MRTTGVGVTESIEQGLSDSSFGREQRAIEPLLDLALTQTNSQGAYVYRLDSDGGAARLVISCGLTPAHERGFRLNGNGEANGWIHRCASVVLHEKAWMDKRFQDFPEFQKNHFEGVISVPLTASDEIVGMANFCRSQRIPVQPRELAFLSALSLPLGSLLVGAELSERLEALAHRLEDRKLFDRSKGLLQSRYGWTENEAYLYLRRLSRQRRVPMREIALDVINSGEPSAAHANAGRPAGPRLGA